MRPSQLLGLIGILLTTSGCAAFKSKSTGLVDGKLRPCPPAPKCVSSYYASGIHHIDPLTYSCSKTEAYKRLVSLIEGMPGSRIISHTEDYIHAEFVVTSIKWVDDVEFLFSDDNKTIHFSSSASASVGYWDWGENKRRARRIHELFDGSADR